MTNAPNIIPNTILTFPPYRDEHCQHLREFVLKYLPIFFALLKDFLKDTSNGKLKHIMNIGRRK